MRTVKLSNLKTVFRDHPEFVDRLVVLWEGRDEIGYDEIARDLGVLYAIFMLRGDPVFRWVQLYVLNCAKHVEYALNNEYCSLLEKTAEYLDGKISIDELREYHKQLHNRTSASVRDTFPYKAASYAALCASMTDAQSTATYAEECLTCCIAVSTDPFAERGWQYDEFLLSCKLA
jgi:hypothetical protein